MRQDTSTNIPIRAEKLAKPGSAFDNPEEKTSAPKPKKNKGMLASMAKIPNIDLMTDIHFTIAASSAAYFSLAAILAPATAPAMAPTRPAKGPNQKTRHEAGVISPVDTLFVPVARPTMTQNTMHARTPPHRKPTIPPISLFILPHSSLPTSRHPATFANLPNIGGSRQALREGRFVGVLPLLTPPHCPRPYT
jgi:hypothetical protein